MKFCIDCEQIFPATLDYFSPAQNGRFASRCKPCNASYVAHYREQRPEQCRLSNRQWKLRHPDYKSPNDFNWRSQHREALLAQQRERRVKNPERFRNNEQRSRNRHRGQVRRRTAIYNQQRRALKKNLVNDFTEIQWQKALEYFEHRCAVCEQLPTFWNILARDHWIPLTKGGGYTVANIIPLCHSQKDGSDGCNNSKLNKDPEHWLISRFGKRKANAILKRINAYFEWVKQQDKVI